MNTPHLISVGAQEINAQLGASKKPNFSEKGEKLFSRFMWMFFLKKKTKRYASNKHLAAVHLFVALSKNIFSKYGIRTGLIVASDFLEEEGFQKLRRIPADRVERFEKDLANENIKELQELFRDFWTCPPIEERQSKRKDVNLPLRYDSTDGQSKNMSKTGIGIVGKKYTLPGTKIQVQLINSPETDISYEVIWCKKYPEQIKFNIGARLTEANGDCEKSIDQVISNIH